MQMKKHRNRKVNTFCQLPLYIHHGEKKIERLSNRKEFLLQLLKKEKCLTNSVFPWTSNCSADSIFNQKPPKKKDEWNVQSSSQREQMKTFTV